MASSRSVAFILVAIDVIWNFHVKCSWMHQIIRTMGANSRSCLAFMSCARQLRSELCATVLGDSLVDDYLLRVKTLIDELVSVGDPIPLQQHIDVVLEGLPQEYGPVISVIENIF